MARSQLVQILQDHGVKAFTRGGRLFAYALYSDLGGYIHENIVELPASLRAVRDFLEY